MSAPKPGQPHGSTHTIIGVVSDTHGHLPVDVAMALEGVDLILHAGDIDTPHVFELLSQLAPVQAVRGNMDQGNWARSLPVTLPVELPGALIYVLHDLARLDLDPAAAGMRVVVSGHTHRAAIEQRGRVLFLNPGSACFPRGAEPRSIARLEVSPQGLVPAIIALDR